MWHQFREMDLLPYIDNLGLKHLRREIVKMFAMTSEDSFTEHTKRDDLERIEVSEEKMREAIQRVMITHGCSQGIFHLMTNLKEQLRDPHDTEKPLCLVEEPTYFIMPSLIEEAGWRIGGVQMSDDGIDLDALEERLKKEQGRVKALYTIPVFQNPSGITLSHSKRQRLVELSRKYNFYIVADEVYQLLHFDEDFQIRPLAFYDEDYDRRHPQSDTTPKVLSVGSFSKVVAPGIKLGYVLVARGSKFLEVFSKEAGLHYSGGGNNPYNSGIINQAIQDGSFEENLLYVRDSYSQRLDALHAALQHHGYQYFEYHKPRGGYFLWVRIKLRGDERRSSDEEMDAFYKACEKRKVQVVDGNKCCVSGGHHDYLRLCFGWLEVHEIEEGVKRVVHAIEDVIGKSEDAK
eukprot:CAMPEP_0117445768 /NCGR_PEP_ID=MMETSP0759-20121206/5974_1 /TAXON_ID=63605 /ORGANISM="Percolomonas cosmopolitus, Strain WS" /LENGTH=403 /DNA_ID=CAMNT_0005237971 /DNA_START=409 /DNA_END=1620 /DNA_ORIENTATION=+